MSYFYYIGFIILLSTIYNLIKFNILYEIRKWKYKFYKVTGSEPSIIDFRTDKSYRLYKNQNIFYTLEFIWLVLGLITDYWYFFFIILSFGLILNMYLYNIRFKLSGKIISFLFVLSRFIIYSYVLIKFFRTF